MSKSNYSWNKTTLYYVKCSVYDSNKMISSFIRPTYAKDPISACNEAIQNTIVHSTRETLFFTIVGEKNL